MTHRRQPTSRSLYDIEQSQLIGRAQSGRIYIRDRFDTLGEGVDSGG